MLIKVYDAGIPRVIEAPDDAEVRRDYGLLHQGGDMLFLPSHVDGQDDRLLAPNFAIYCATHFLYGLRLGLIQPKPATGRLDRH